MSKETLAAVGLSFCFVILSIVTLSEVVAINFGDFLWLIVVLDSVQLKKHIQMNV